MRVNTQQTGFSRVFFYSPKGSMIVMNSSCCVLVISTKLYSVFHKGNAGSDCQCIAVGSGRGWMGVNRSEGGSRL